MSQQSQNAIQESSGLSLMPRKTKGIWRDKSVCYLSF